MKKHIVYITYYKGKLLPPFYIGSSYEEKILEGYNGSIRSKKWSSIYKKEQKENKHLFKTRIVSHHETRKEALEEELRLQKKHNVMTNIRYFNESYAQINGYFGRDVSEENNPNYGNKWSKEQKENRKKYLGSIVIFEGREVTVKTRNAIKRGRKADSEKHKKTINSKEWKETTGKLQTEKRLKSRDIKYLEHCARYNIMKNNEIIEYNVPEREIMNIGRKLKESNKENLFCSSKGSQAQIKNKKYINCYVIKIKEKE